MDVMVGGLPVAVGAGGRVNMIGKAGKSGEFRIYKVEGI